MCSDPSRRQGEPERAPANGRRTIRILTVVGARPQFVKAAVVSRLLASRTGFEEIMVHTGQHYDPEMNEVFFRELEIPSPAVALNIGSAGHGIQTGRMLEALEPVIGRERPDAVLVYGDTNSTLAGAIAGAKMSVPVVHVEAGMRSFNRRMPEEINRVLADHAADWLLASTQEACENLRREGIAEKRIRWVGDVMLDAVRLFGGKARAESRALERLGLKPRGYALATVHRAGNTDDPARLARIWEGLGALAGTMPVVFPAHPRTRERLRRLGVRPVDGLREIEPVGYLDMVCLEANARLILTDSGGVQKEAYFHRVPCLTLRAETEWVELVRAGWNRLTEPDPAALLAASGQMLAARLPEPDDAIYGGGLAAERILALLGEVL